MQPTRHYRSYSVGVPTKPGTSDMELCEKWMETKLSKDPMTSIYNKVNKRIRINTSKRQTKMDEWSIYRKNSKSYMANMDNKKQPNI